MNDLHFSESLTPEIISKTENLYVIPIYQRLFEWDKTKIEVLLKDLKMAFETNKEQPYYIGMLTSKKTIKKIELIDGQQRFTVMILLGLVMRSRYIGWERFVKLSDGRIRLFLPSRTNDNTLLSALFEKEKIEYTNIFMQKGIEFIEGYLCQEFDDKTCVLFCEYVFKKMSFFISQLPIEYSDEALNRYFETMNSTGKNLESHEILKIMMLKLPHRFDRQLLTQIWNVVSVMNRKLIRRRKEEKNADMLFRYEKALALTYTGDINGIFSYHYINSLSIDDFDEDDFPLIGKIEAHPVKPSSHNKTTKDGFNSIISFSDFLLQILFLYLEKKGISIGPKDSFFDTTKLLDTFTKYLHYIDADDFVIQLLRYRLLFDHFVIVVSTDDVKSSYDINVAGGGNDEYGNSFKDCLLMYESLLYVNSSVQTLYQWLPRLLDFVDKNEKMNCKDVYYFLKSNDENLYHTKECIEDVNKLSFSTVDRYWFWKLDFLIWQQRTEIFKDETVRKVADRYMFRRTRSIEHIAPQTPEKNSTLLLSDKDMNCFGNLVMISSALNSSLRNSTFEIKRAKAKSHINMELSGTIESLKMLMIYEYETWSSDTIQKHQDKCINLLTSGFSI